MPTYSNSSLEQLDSCHKDLQLIFNTVIQRVDCKLLQGHRGASEQNRLYAEGRSKLEYPDSKHNKLPSEAIDVVPYPVDWDDVRRFDRFAGYVLGVADSLNIELIWGGDWDRDWDLSDNRFNDLPHFQLVHP